MLPGHSTPRAGGAGAAAGAAQLTTASSELASRFAAVRSGDAGSLEAPVSSGHLEFETLASVARVCPELMLDGPPVRVARWALVNTANTGCAHHPADGPHLRVLALCEEYDVALAAAQRLAGCRAPNGAAWAATTRVVPTCTWMHVPAGEPGDDTDAARHCEAVLANWREFQLQRALLARALAAGALTRGATAGLHTYATLPEAPREEPGGAATTQQADTEVREVATRCGACAAAPGECAHRAPAPPLLGAPLILPLRAPVPAALALELAGDVPQPLCLISVLGDTTCGEEARRGDAAWCGKARALREYALASEPEVAAALGWARRCAAPETPAEECDVLVPPRRAFTRDSHARPLFRIYPFCLPGRGAGARAVRDVAARLLMQHVRDVDITTHKLGAWEDLAHAPAGPREFREAPLREYTGAHANKRREARGSGQGAETEEDPMGPAPPLDELPLELDSAPGAWGPLTPPTSDVHVTVDGRSVAVPPHLMGLFPESETCAFGEVVARCVDAIPGGVVGPVTSKFLEDLMPAVDVALGLSWETYLSDGEGSDDERHATHEPEQRL